jgi:hypothetical protein
MLPVHETEVIPRSLSPGKAPGKRPKLDEKARRLLEADVEERPFVKLSDRREYLTKVAGVSVSDTEYVCIMTHYAKDDKAYAAPEFRTVGEPLPQSPRSSLTQPLPDPLAHQRR